MSDQELVTVEKVTEVEETEVSQASPADASPDSAEVEAAPIPPKEASPQAPTEESASSTDVSTESSESDAFTIHSLKSGQHLNGQVKNITGFGAFVDVGLAQDGLVHISELARQKVEKVTDIVSEGQEVDVWVKKVDRKRGRISLTMIKPIALRLREIAENAELKGVVTRLEPYGAFIDIGSERNGLVHISQITHDYIKHPEDALAIGDQVKVKVLKVNRKKRQVDLSIKALLPPPPPKEEVKKVEKVEEPKKVEKGKEVVEEEPMPTAMAVAYAAMRHKGQADRPDKSTSFGRGKSQHKKEIDDIITRTLAKRE